MKVAQKPGAAFSGTVSTTSLTSPKMPMALFLVLLCILHPQAVQLLRSWTEHFCRLLAGRQSFYLKPAAAIVSARRAGTTATFDQLNKYFTISEMPVISSRYWNMVHGATPEDVKKDLEGFRTMRVLARNMAWFLKCKEAGMMAGVTGPVKEENIHTNFIRD